MYDKIPNSWSITLSWKITLYDFIHVFTIVRSTSAQEESTNAVVLSVESVDFSFQQPVT